MACNAKCICGQSTMMFPNLKEADIDGKWEAACCIDKGVKLPEQPKEEAKAEQPKAEKKQEDKKPKFEKESFSEKFKKVTKRVRKEPKADEPKEQ